MVICSGLTRLSEQPIHKNAGFWPSDCRVKKSARSSISLICPHRVDRFVC